MAHVCMHVVRTYLPTDRECYVCTCKFTIPNTIVNQFCAVAMLYTLMCIISGIHSDHESDHESHNNEMFSAPLPSPVFATAATSEVIL